MGSKASSGTTTNTYGRNVAWSGQKFRDLPIGAQFRFPSQSDIYVKRSARGWQTERYGNGSVGSIDVAVELV